MLHSEVIFGIASGLVSLFFYIVSQTFPQGTGDGVPGPGFFPIALSIVLLILSIALIISGLKKSEKYFKLTDNMKKNLKPLFLTVIAMFLFLIIWRYIPFYISAFVYMLCLNLIFKQKLKFAIPFSILITGVIYYVFSNIFNVMLNI